MSDPGAGPAGRPARESLGALTSEAQRRYLGEVAESLDSRLPAIVREMRDLLAQSIPELNTDPQLVEMLQASIEGNVSTICHVLANGIAISHLQPTTAAVEYAQRLAQRDIPISALTRAYYLGQSMFLRLGIDAVEKLPVQDEERIELVRAVADTVHHYIDWMLQFVSDVHEKERRGWRSARSAVIAAAVTRVLHGEDRSGRAFEAETGYALEGDHLALIVWSDDDTTDRTLLHGRIVRRVAGDLGAPRPPLAVQVDPGITWAWIPLPAALPVGAGAGAGAGRQPAGAAPLIARALEDAPDVRVALGQPRAGIAGFRTSHDQAADARRIALSSAPHRSQRVIAHSDPAVSLLSLLIKDAPAARRWVQDVLGPLATGDDDHARQLRATLAAYYAAGENFTRAAQALGIHRNTVHHRVSRFLDAGRDIDPLEAALALRLYAAFGPDERAGPPAR